MHILFHGHACATIPQIIVIYGFIISYIKTKSPQCKDHDNGTTSVPRIRGWISYSIVITDAPIDVSLLLLLALHEYRVIVFSFIFLLHLIFILDFSVKKLFCYVLLL